jgi:hypothetical protein
MPRLKAQATVGGECTTAMIENIIEFVRKNCAHGYLMIDKKACAD